MILVFVDEITPRITYVFDFIFKVRGFDYELTTDEQLFQESTDKKLNYTRKEKEGLNILPSQLLFEHEIHHYTVAKSKFLDTECLSFDGVTDIVASVFYVLTRFEEYTSSQKDEHGRFPFSESCLQKYEWIEQAICDRWAHFILKELDIDKPNYSTQIVPTFDIDNTFAYRLKEGKYKILSILKDVIYMDFSRLTERRRVLKGEVDPYDTFSTIKNIAKKFSNTTIFWLVGERAEKDRNIPLSNREHQRLVKEMDTVASVNLHPSYFSNGDKRIIVKEKKELEKVLDREVLCSRQHFLRFQLPTTFQSLIEAGFFHEYSMGFAENVGFRCGTARSHFWFDLSTDAVTELKIHPFVYMDGTLNEYMHLSIEESKVKIEELYQEVQQQGGDFVFLWHNETIGDYKKWKGWSEVLNYTLNLDHE